jgi:hypothetical protein
LLNRYFSAPSASRALPAALVLALGVCACGDGEAERGPQGPASVTIAWNSNHESSVNRAGGGYEVSISGRPAIDVPYTSGAAAPTSTTLTLASGTYSVTVRAYGALDAQGGTGRNASAASQVLTVSVQ